VFVQVRAVRHAVHGGGREGALRNRQRPRELPQGPPSLSYARAFAASRVLETRALTKRSLTLVLSSRCSTRWTSTATYAEGGPPWLRDGNTPNLMRCLLILFVFARLKFGKTSSLPKLEAALLVLNFILFPLVLVFASRRLRPQSQLINTHVPYLHQSGFQSQCMH
jgi:hypothetical protein